MGKVLEFPKEKFGKFHPNEIAKRKSEQTDLWRQKLDKSIRHLTNDLFFKIKEDLEKSDIPLGDRFNADYAYVEEAIVAMFYRLHGLEHPVQIQMDMIGHGFIVDPELQKEKNNDKPDPGPITA